MSANIDDGGSAFPIPAESHNGEIHWACGGMTLRDWFAGTETIREWDNYEAAISKECAEALAGEKQPERGWSDPIRMFQFEAKWRAALKYIRAYAMIKERNK